MTPLTVFLGASLGLGAWLITLSGLSLIRRTKSPAIDTDVPGNQRKRPRLFGLTALLEEAGLDAVDPRAVLLGGLVAGAVMGVLVVAVIPIPVLGAIAAVATPVVGGAYLSRLKNQRASRLRKSWPGVIDHLRAGVRSGHDVTGALLALPKTLPRDIVDPLEELDLDLARGLATDDVLERLGRRLADPVGDRIVEVLRMAHEVGGMNLPSVLLDLQKSVRADIAVREDAHAQQSWIRSASVLAVCAPWVVLLLIGTREATLTAYQSPEGAGILVLGAVASMVAFGMMKKIGSLPVQRRWLG